MEGRTLEREGGIPVIVMGLGEIGRAIALAALVRPGLQLVGAVDPAPGLAGRTLSELLGVPAPAVTVTADPAEPLRAARGGVVLHSTGSLFEQVLPQLEAAVRAGVSVVSTCEELAWPWLRFEEAADRLDRLCEANGVAVVGTGVNPGFVLDRLPAFLSQVTGPVRHVRAVRVVDTLRARPALVAKSGAGLDEETFHARADSGEIGHVGLAESAALAAAGCGLEVDEVDEEIVPLVAEEELHGRVTIPRGRVAGLQHVVRGFFEEREIVRLELTLAAGAADPHDEVELDADPPVRILIPGGLAGAAATANAVVNAAAAVAERKGLITVLDLPAGR
jgi:4-hydroxy-tetrahydrodipicolinate reductase